MKLELEKDIVQWDVKSWSMALHYWEKEINWEQIHDCLELGGREGGLSLWLALKGKTVICSDLKGVEFSAGELHQKYNIGSSIKYQGIDATNIPYENHFDLIIFKSIIGGIGRDNNKEIQQMVFDQIHKALKPEGKLIFAENLVASPFHQYFRKKFTKWTHYWRYITKEECKEFLKFFSSFELKTTGVLGTFGRTEKQKNLLSRVDKFLLNNITPDSWKYIVYGIATK